MSTARRMPNDRIVRSTGWPVARRRRALLTGPTRAPCGRRRCSRSAGRCRRAGRPQRTVTATVLSASMRALRLGAVRANGSCRRRRARRAGRAPRPSRRLGRAADVGGPATSTSSIASAGATAAIASAMPAVRTTRTTPVPSARTPAASGGRFGPSRTTSSRLATTRTGAAVAVGQLRGPRRAVPLASLAAEGAAVGQRRWPARRRARTRRRRARGRPAPPTWCAACGPSRPAGPRRGQGSADRGAAALHLAGARPGLRQRLADDPRAVAGARTATRASAGAVSSAKPPSPERDRRRRPAARCPPRAAARRAAAARSRPADAGPARRREPRRALPRIVCQPVQRHRWASSAWSTVARPAAGRPAARAASRTTIPGVQNPHWLAPVAQNALAQRPRSAASRPSMVVTARPATRRAGVTHATRGCPSTRTVQQPHWPCGLQPSLGEWSPSRSRSTSSSEAPSSGIVEEPDR